jgi:hypothetical protein
MEHDLLAAFAHFKYKPEAFASLTQRTILALDNLRLFWQRLDEIDADPEIYAGWRVIAAREWSLTEKEVQLIEKFLANQRPKP